MRSCDMSETGSQIENQPNTGGYPDGDVENEKRRPRWLVGLLIATSLLVILAVGAYFLLGRELFQRPFLAVAVVIAWLGALVGISIGSDPG
jgi:hypothetical protein